MTINDIRSDIYVFYWFVNGPVTHLEYRFDTTRKMVQIPTINIIEELIAIGSIDNAADFLDYQLSQWDALNLAIRREYALALEQESGMIDINNAIDKLKHKSNE